MIRKHWPKYCSCWPWAIGDSELSSLDRNNGSFPLSGTVRDSIPHILTLVMVLTDERRCSLHSSVFTAPVTLDPDTASNKLMVSQDCTSVKYVETKMDVSDIPKRLNLGVLASQGFSWGLHCWDVEVGDNNTWTLGVVGETVNRKKLIKMDPKSRFWCFRYVSGKYKKGTKPVKEDNDDDDDERPNIIRLQLDFYEGELRFIEPFRNRLLCTFTGGFPERVFPYFCTGDLSRPLNVFPANKQLWTN